MWKSIVRKVKLPMYGCTVEVIFTDDLKKQVSRIAKRNKEEIILEGEAEGLFVNFDIDYYYFIIDFKYLSHNVIVHELWHLVSQIMKHRDIVDNETGAYTIGFLAECVYKILKSKNIEVPK